MRAVHNKSVVATAASTPRSLYSSNYRWLASQAHLQEFTADKLTERNLASSDTATDN